MNKIFIALLLPLVIFSKGYGQDLRPPFTTVTSDFGPRHVTQGSWFHKGIDYGAGLGTTINAVESGVIRSIRWWGTGGYAVFIVGSHGEWIYAHMFSGKKDSLPQTLNNIEIRNVTLVSPNDPNLIRSANAIIFWTGTTNQANKIITAEAVNWWVRNPDGSYIKNYNGTVNIRTWNTVNATTGFNIGPVGSSGTSSGPHLHLALDNQTNNPLLHVARPAASNYILEIVRPSEGDDGITNDGIRVNRNNGRIPAFQSYVLSRPSLDLDKVKIYLDAINDQHMIAEFSYGGRDGEDRTANITSTTGSASGVIPVPSGSGEDAFLHIPWDISGIPNGMHTLYSKVIDIRGVVVKIDTLEVEFDDILTAQAIQPAPGTPDVPVCGGGQKTNGAQIIIAFNRPVDPATFDQSRVTFNPPLVGTFTHSWSDSCDTLTMTLTDSETDLRYSTRYEVTLSQEIRDTEGEKLDGDGDGFPGGDYVFEFTTRAPQISFSGGVEMFGPMPQSKVVQGTVTNQEPRPVHLAFSDTSGSLSGADGDWSYEVALPQLVLAAGETRELGIVHLSHDAGGADAYGVPIEAFASPVSKGRAPGGVRADFMGASTDSGGNGSGSGSGGLGNGPGGDQGLIVPGPDDNWSLSDPIYPTPWLVDTRSEIGLLLSGFCSATGHLLGKYGMKTSLVSARDLRVVSNDINDLNEIKVLIVASGGLRGKEYDQGFWQKLGQYVWDGGYLVVLDQPYGSLYSMLPGNPQARGWAPSSKACPYV